MSTRAQIRFATREDGVSFSEHPEKIHAQFYKHSDGYPEGLGLDIAMSYADQEIISGWEIEHVQTKHGDLEYIYYIWSDYERNFQLYWLPLRKIYYLEENQERHQKPLMFEMRFIIN